MEHDETDRRFKTPDGERGIAVMHTNWLTIDAIGGRLSVIEGLEQLRLKGKAPTIYAIRPSISLDTHVSSGCFAFKSIDDNRECLKHSRLSNQFASLRRCKLANKKLSTNLDSSKPEIVVSSRRIETREALNRAVGLDKIALLMRHDLIRHGLVEQRTHLSMIDLMDVFGNFKNDPSKYWSQEKSRLLALDIDLSHSVRKFKFLSADGKMRPTDVAPIWSGLLIVSFLQTPQSIDLMKAIFQGVGDGMDRSLSEIKYRLQNIESGMEWAADGIHKQLESKGLLNDPDLFAPSKNYMRGGDR